MRFVAAVKADYYEVLGVSRDAGEEAIEKAFHTAARDLQPDLSDSPEAEGRFRELAEAYGVLSKPAARLLYDRYGYRGRANSVFDEALLDAEETGAPGEPIQLQLELQASEAAEGATRSLRFDAKRPCEACSGQGTASGGDLCARCGGTGWELVERRLDVRTPPGIHTGTLLRVNGEGDAGDRGGVPGDLLLEVVVLPGPYDRPLLRYVSLALFLCALGLLIAYLLLG
jgi:DnaJ-class molecular chaperone